MRVTLCVANFCIKINLAESEFYYYYYVHYNSN
jgi:hypothetical protein